MSDSKSDISPVPSEFGEPAMGDSRAEGGLHFSGTLLARNTFYNLFGLGAPLLIAFLTIPPLIKGLGTDRFGLLSLAWMVAGYFNIFDLGIGRATTKLVAEYSARGSGRELRTLIRSSFLASFGFGVIGAVIAALMTGWVVIRVLNLPADLVTETRDAFYMLALAIPALLLTAGARGVLEAQQRFKLASAVKIPGSLAAFLIPLCLLPVTHSIYVIVAGLTISKYIVCAFYVWFALRSLPPDEPGTPFVSREHVRQLMAFGKWATVTNLVAPIMSQIDRFIIGSILTISAVTYYITPYELMSKLFIIPIGIITVLFPVFSAYAVDQHQKLADLRLRSVRMVLLAVLPVVVGTVVLARPFLTLWLNPEFADKSALLMQVLGVGVLTSSVARIALSTIEAVGRPDLAAKMFLIELPISLGLQMLCTWEFGIIGAAVVWTVRTTIEMFILLWLSHRLVPEKSITATASTKTLLIGPIAAFVIAFLLGTIANLALQLVLLAGLLTVLLWVGWTKVLESTERTLITELMQAVMRQLRPARRG